MTEHYIYCDSAGFYVADFFGDGMPACQLSQIKESSGYIGTLYEVGAAKGIILYWELADGDMVFDESTPEDLRNFAFVHDASLTAFREDRECRIPRKVRVQ